eukprot:m.84536 g.84536  ORF g.84536 m.84536 type:complete len:723 (+) comp13478_c0_seq3:214-2382(+)
MLLPALELTYESHEDGNAAASLKLTGWKTWVAAGGLKRVLCLLFLVLGLHTRLVDIAMPDSIAWDETHFGKFASYYINRTYYFDVHPPLAKMLLGAAGWVSGYDGAFDFKQPGQAYGDTRYVGMRALCGILGGLCVPLVFLTVATVAPLPAATIAASIVLFDASCITLSRFILLDPILLFFICLSLFLLTHTITPATRANPFSLSWWLVFAATGAALACAASSKWVGLFVVLTAGLVTAFDLWSLLGDLTLSLKGFIAHVVARITTLIVLPTLLYFLFFKIHFMVLVNSGPGDSFMSSAFQTTLVNNSLHNCTDPARIAYGSVVTLRGERAGAGLLHSHPHLYPKGMVQQQQITTYSHKDANNLWRIKDVPGNGEPSTRLIEHGHRVRLEHTLTRRNLHSHAHPAPITAGHQQVTGYGVNGTGDINDEWTVHVVEGPDATHVHRIVTRFRLLHHTPGLTRPCALAAVGTRLPSWGFEQGEVTCSPDTTGPGTLWNIEEHTNALLPPGQPAAVQPSFWRTVLELHASMGSVNNALVPKEGEDTSRPWQWPINYKGQRFTAWGDKDPRVYLLGDPVAYWLALVAVLTAIALLLVDALLLQRGAELPTWLNQEERTRTRNACILFLLAWVLHYAPFYLMGRVLYFHHYLPAFVCSAMVTGILIDFLLTCIQRACHKTHLFRLCGVLSVILVLWTSHRFFSCMAYGMHWPLAHYRPLRWLPSWEIA